MATKKDIIDAVVELVQDSSGPMRNLVGRWVNIVLDDIASRGLLRSLQREESASLVAGDGSSMTIGRDYDLKSDTDHVFKVFVPAWGNPEGILINKSVDWILAQMMADGVTHRARPRYYTIFGVTTLRLHPIPDLDNAPASPTDIQKIHIWKYKDIAHLAELNPITEIKLKHIPVLIDGAYSMGARFDSLGDRPSAKDDYERGIGRIIADSRLELNRPYRSPYQDV